MVPRPNRLCRPGRITPPVARCDHRSACRHDDKRTGRSSKTGNRDPRTMEGETARNLAHETSECERNHYSSHLGAPTAKTFAGAKNARAPGFFHAQRQGRQAQQTRLGRCALSLLHRCVRAHWRRPFARLCRRYKHPATAPPTVFRLSWKATSTANAPVRRRNAHSNILSPGWPPSTKFLPN